MKNNIPTKSFLPQCDGRALDFIKILAAIFMVIDHTNEICLQHTRLLMEMVGRGTFPLFCYAVAMAILKIKSASIPCEGRGPDPAKSWIPAFAGTRQARYINRLFIGALISQPFYFFAFGGDTLNVIFTLALGAVFAIVSFRAQLWQMYALYIAAAVSMLWFVPLEFGFAGVMVPSAIVLALRGNKSAYPFLILLLVMMNAAGILPVIQHHQADLNSWIVAGLNGLASIILPWLALDLARALPQTGRWMPKYAFYVFYPAHLVILKLIALV
jgi:hypothetical protein